MTPQEAIQVLKKYQSWRLGTEQYQFQDRKVVTQAINVAIAEIEKNIKKHLDDDFSYLCGKDFCKCNQ